MGCKSLGNLGQLSLSLGSAVSLGTLRNDSNLWLPQSWNFKCSITVWSQGWAAMMQQWEVWWTRYVFGGTARCVPCAADWDCQKVWGNLLIPFSRWLFRESSLPRGKLVNIFQMSHHLSTHRQCLLLIPHNSNNWWWLEIWVSHGHSVYLHLIFYLILASWSPKISSFMDHGQLTLTA